MSRLRVEDAWAVVAGELAGQTRVFSFWDGVATIAVANSCLLYELGGFRRRELLEKLRARLPDLYIHDLRFRAGPIERSESAMNTATTTQKQTITTEASPAQPAS